MRRIDLLITQARRESENEEFSDTSGITDVEFLQYFNDAQHRLQSVIIAQHPSVFIEEVSVTAVPNQEAYNLPSDAFLFNNITNVEYSTNSNNFYSLTLASLKRRASEVNGYPRYYIRKSGQILLSPTPQSAGTIRLNYIKRIDELDSRRGSVASSVVTADSITSLFLNVTTDSVDNDNLAEHEFVCLVDKNGVIKMKNIPVDDIDASTGEVTVTSGFTFEEGETISVGDYIVGGKDTTTHPELPRNCERYLIKYCVWKILKRDSSTDYAEAQQELLAMETDIINSYAELTDDIVYIPDLNSWYEWS